MENRHLNKRAENFKPDSERLIDDLIEEIESLEKQVSELTDENERLKEQLNDETL